MMTKQDGNLLTQSVQEETIAYEGLMARGSLPAAYIPTPTREYQAHRKTKRAAFGAGVPPAPYPMPVPAPAIQGSRMLRWKQSPGGPDLSIYKTYISARVLSGPKDSRIAITGQPVSPNALGDFIQTPGTEAFDSVSTYAIARQTLTMYQRALASIGTSCALPWQWNSATNTDPLCLAPRGLPDTMNAFYSRSARGLRFGDFMRPGSSPPLRVYTCRSADIVSHQTGHAILDGLKPNWMLSACAPQTGALHEAFADLTAIFLALSEFDQVETIIAQTRANLQDKTLLADLAEEFGLALGRRNGLRNADNDYQLSQVPANVNALSQVFTGSIYDILADIFAFERKPARTDDAVVLYAVNQYLCGLLLRAIIAAPANNATFADVINQMLTIAGADGKPAQYRNIIRNRFVQREVVVCSTPMTADHKAGVNLEASKFQADPKARQNRAGCCGTMQHADFNGDAEALEEELEELKNSFNSKSKGGRGITPVSESEENETHQRSRL